ncbi:MAG: class I SAM-dependent methyltransferase family protein [Candidatus Thorarchaeota archaeon]
MKIKTKLQKSLKNIIDPSLLDKIPSGYSVIGDIAIFHHINEDLNSIKKHIGDLIIQFDPQVSVVIEQIETKSVYRKPVIKYIAGEKRTLTIHKEYNTLFHIDVSKITFSPGNKGERGFLINAVKNGEIICDMFACIGNLSLPIVVNNPNITVYGIEANKDAFDFLKKNIKENDVQGRYYPVFGDNRVKTPEGIANRVIMGFFESDIVQFTKAVDAIQDEGLIHYHFTSSRNNNYNFENLIISAKDKVKFRVESSEIRKIKKVSPRLIHYCADIKILK